MSASASSSNNPLTALDQWDDYVEERYRPGKSETEFRQYDATANPGVAEFYRFISEIDQDLLWHKATGYVPITLAAYEKARAEGYYVQNPGADAAIIQLSRAEPTPNSMGFRLGGFVEIRNILQEELEKGFQGQQDAATLLANATRRGNVVLRNFEKANKA